MVVRVCPICDIAECTTHDPERQRGRITTPDELVERVARALAEDRGYDLDKNVNFRPAFRRMATAALAAARDTIRREAMEEAAKVVLEQRFERGTPWDNACLDAAAAIRALIEKEPA